MEPFKIHILGCGSALPTLHHNASSQIVEIREKLFMIDCGEGTQMQLRKSKIRFTKISAVFISHLHGDHCFGLIGMISTFGMLGRTATLHVYAPADFGPILQQQIDFFCSGLEFKVEFHPVDTSKSQVIYEDRSLTIETIPLEHRIACCGFIFREKPLKPHIRRDMLDFLQIPVSQINNIKAGADWTTESGQVIPNSRLVIPADPARSYAYCSDTRYIPTLHQLLCGIDTIYHESTYTSDYEDRARLYYHSTSKQAASVARDAGAKQLLLGHYSARYIDESKILAEAKTIFPNSKLTDEGKIFDV
ncbi:MULTISPECIES: ribonuclease Z [Segatella]|jgi:ribonuclease Z|uniref:Ribonuclease Z n=2 Tax=Segatella TaxID=2974251 RepID=D8DWE6_9BACT|nr:MULTISPECIES: ribonuclease Z [Segatella]EFI72206.1 ribonuclease Z [Segatella baroniae B14]UKK78548.1 ribonuclease Z [Segatella baroniae B14]GJG27134.1 ribonuclease Z [Segatella bryantii]SEQ07969.1 ribonuclease Z [Segatella baroniae B14]